jgi:hypothetical protein
MRGESTLDAGRHGARPTAESGSDRRYRSPDVHLAT